jgi:diketogulonate reductase-like aldo/keto reductase
MKGKSAYRVCNFGLPLLEKASAACLSPAFNSLLTDGAKRRRNGILAFCKKNGIGVKTYGSLGGEF